MARLRLLWISCALAAFAACSTSQSADLLRVRRISPTWIEPGTDVRIAGDGFPVGRDAAVLLEGCVHRPGAPRRDVRVRIRARAVSAERVDFTARSNLVRALGGRGTFEGSVRVAFEGADGLPSVSGVRRDVSLDVVPDTPNRLADEDRLSDRARGWLGTLALEPDEDDMGPGIGVRVEHVARGGPAWAAGIRAGDRITDLDGVRPASLADLAPRTDVEAVPATLQRGDAPFTVRLPGPHAWPSVPHALPWLIAAVLAFLAFVGPSARPVGRILRAIERSVVVGVGSGSVVSLGARLPLTAAAAAVASFGWLPSSLPTIPWAAYLACATASALLASSHGARPRRLAELTAPVAVVATLAAARLLLGVSSAEWPLALAHPIGLVAFIGALRAGFAVPVRGDLRSASLWFGEAARAIGAVCLVEAFLVPPSSLGTGGAPGEIGFVATVVAAAALSTVAAGVQHHMAAPRSARPGPCAPVIVPVAYAAAWAEAPPWLAPTFGSAVLGVAGAVLAIGIARGLRVRIAGRPPSELRLHPFL